MLIQVDNTWRLVTDQYCWQVQRFAGVYQSGKRADQPKYKALKYCPSLRGALRALAFLMLHDADTHTAREALAAIERVSDRVDELTTEIDKQCLLLNSRKEKNSTWPANL